MYTKNINIKRKLAVSKIKEIGEAGFVFATLPHGVSAASLEYVRNVIPRFRVVRGNFIRCIYREYHSDELPNELSIKNCVYIFFSGQDFLEIKKQILDSKSALSDILKALKIKNLITNLFYFNANCKGINITNIKYNSTNELYHGLCSTLRGIGTKLVRTLQHNSKKLLLILKTHEQNR